MNLHKVHLKQRNLSDVNLLEVKRINLEHQKERLLFEVDQDIIYFIKKDIQRLINYLKINKNK
jgi:hypothetical protein